MREETRKAYLRRADTFYRTELGGKPPSPQRVLDALGRKAQAMRPDSWRVLRNAVATAQEAAGYADAAQEIRAFRNPATAAGAGSPVPKQRRQKGVKKEDAIKLFRYLIDRGDKETFAVADLCRITGCRPSEIEGIELRGNDVFIPSSKKTERGDRGLDRLVTLDPENLKRVKIAIDLLPDRASAVETAQDRIRRAGLKLWPRRKSVPTLYSFRHQLGSELKASGLDDREIAYVMGHQATSSVERYGDRRRGSGNVPMRASPNAKLAAIRDTKKPMNVGRNKGQDNTQNFDFSP